MSVSALVLGAGAVLAAPPSGAAAAVDDAGRSGVRQVLVRDACDPATFNAAIGPGTCVREGGTTFGDFIAQLTSNGRAVGWAFTPSRPYLQQGDRIAAFNKGGEFHSFTRVAEFGGGCVKQLNDILGLTPVPECRQTVVVHGKRVPKIVATGVAPGQTLTVRLNQVGTFKYECLIHPWMHAIVHVRAADTGTGQPG